jgi:AbrB family looped-hinge helix DNA binding protein
MQYKPKAPEGKFMSTVKIGEKGQIVIPKAARDMMGIKPGDTVLLLADVERGIAIMNNNVVNSVVDKIMAVSKPPKGE